MPELPVAISGRQRLPGLPGWLIRTGSDGDLSLGFFRARRTALSLFPT
jgi:hypothetical protein